MSVSILKWQSTRNQRNKWIKKITFKARLQTTNDRRYFFFNGKWTGWLMHGLLMSYNKNNENSAYAYVHTVKPDMIYTYIFFFQSVFHIYTQFFAITHQKKKS